MPTFINGLVLRYSGGATNTDKNASLGGVMSTENAGVYSPQSITRGGSPISGITVHASFSNPSSGTLEYDPPTVSWTPSGSVTLSRDVASDGLYDIGGSKGRIIFSIVSSALPGSYTSETLTIGTPSNNLFDAITYDERVAGDTEYRCLWLKNYTSENYGNLELSVTTDAANSDIELGSDWVLGDVATPWLSVTDAEKYAVITDGAVQLIATTGGNPTQIEFLTADGWALTSTEASGADYQDSDGATGDLPVTLANENDSTNQLASVPFGTTLTWPNTLNAGNALSFWIKRIKAADGGSPQYNESARLNLDFTEN